MIWRKVS